MYNSTTVLHKAVAEFVAKSWEEVLNVKVDLSAQEWGVFLDSRRKGNYEMARNGWVSDWNDPSSMLTIFVSGGGNNDGNYLNPKFDEFMKESYATSDREARMTALHNAEKVLMDDWACAPLMQYRQNFTVSEKLKDWTYLSIGYTMFHKASISE